MAAEPPPSRTPTRTALGPATRLLWRAPHSVQLELGSRAVVVDGLTAEQIRALTPSGDGLATDALAADARSAVETLTGAGFLWTQLDRADTDDERLSPPTARLAPELRSLQVVRGWAGAQVLAGRRYAGVEIAGTGKVAAHLAAVLAAAGVGQVRCTATGDVRLADAVPGGLLPGDEGSPRMTAAGEAVRRAAPESERSPLAGRTQTDLVVLVLDAPLDEDRRTALHARDVPYLCVSVTCARGVVGPLTVPGLTSCPRCADLERGDRDPAWSALAAQLSTSPRHGSAPDAALATLVCGVAAMQALQFLDGDRPATVDGTLELHEPDWRLRRRSWPSRPDCGCELADPRPT